jgi:nucleotide-binding universal stress UspA family protein
MNGAVIVGYDETLAGERALAFATEEAALRGVPLEIVNVVRRPTETAEALADWIVDAGERTAHEAHPELSVEKFAAAGRPDEVLVGESRGAGMLVLGDRSHRDSVELREGTVVVHVLDRSSCPVVVLTPGDHRPWLRITAAVDPHGPAGEILSFAFEEAARRGAVLRVVNVRDGRGELDRKALDAGESSSGAAPAADHEKGLERAVAPWRARYPELGVETEVRTGSIGQALVEATCDGDLLIVGGRRHRDGRPGMEAGSTVHMLLHHAECPVAVVPIG